MNYSQLVDLVISKVGYAQPVTGGDNPVSDDEIIEYLNDTFTYMAKKIGGLDYYVEFTITSTGVITVTVPATASLQPGITEVSPQLGSYPAYKIDNSYRIKRIENLTTGMIDTPGRILYSVDKYKREYQSSFETNGDKYYKWVYENARRGIVLLPKKITDTNTIAVTYGKKFTRYSLGDIAASGPVTLDDVSLDGIYTKTDGGTTVYVIKITTAGAQDKFKVSTDGGNTYGATEYDCSPAGADIGNGLTVTFAAVTGHGLNDKWEWTAVAPDLDYFDDDEQREFPCEYAAAMTLQDLQQNEWYDRMKMADATMARFLRNRENEIAEMYESLEY